MEKKQVFQYRFLNWAVLTTCAVLAVSANRQNFSDYFSCRGGYGVGFPVSFLCDYGSGGSPINGWGRIDISDFPFFSLQGFARFGSRFFLLFCHSGVCSLGDTSLGLPYRRTSSRPQSMDDFVEYCIYYRFSLFIIAIGAKPHKLP